MHMLVTGGAGFIGSHLVDRLLRDGHAVRVLDNFSTGRRENLSDAGRDIDLMEGDIRDPETARRAVRDADTVYHLAALGSVPFSVANPMASHAANADGTLTMLVAARDAGARRFVYSSSSSVYGDTPELPKRESMPPNPRSPYAITKLTGELYARTFADLYDIETVSLRYFNIFGPRQNEQSQYAAVIPKFITALLDGRAPTIHGDGKQSRDFTFVDNAVEANILAGRADGAASGEFVNVGCREAVTLTDLYRSLAAFAGADLAPVHGPPRPGDVRDSLADIAKAERVLGYRPVVRWEDGLARTLAWYRDRTRVRA